MSDNTTIESEAQSREISAKILNFPIWHEAKKRLAKIEAERVIVILDAEVAEIHAKVDSEIAKCGGIEAYGKMIMQKKLGVFYKNVWRKP